MFCSECGREAPPAFSFCGCCGAQLVKSIRPDAASAPSGVDRFVVLTCQGCGAGLRVYDDMETFACGYCGVESAVQRRGGTVALKRVAAAIHRVQIGTDKTAAELAIVRLRSEIDALRKRQHDLREADTQSSSFGCGCLVLLAVPVLMLLLHPDTRPIAIIIAAIALCLALARSLRQQSPEESAIAAQIQALERRLEEQRKVVQ